MKIYHELFKVFFKIGLFTFGGGFAMLPLIEEEIVTKNKWVEKNEIYDYFSVSQSFPGAIAINTSTLVGYRIAGKRGALAATIGVILPSFIIISLIAMFFVNSSDSQVVESVFRGINGAVIVLIFLAAKKMSLAAYDNKLSLVLILLSTIVILFTSLSPIVLILLGALVGCLIYAIKEGRL